jgi:hypothetical protein
VRAANRFVGNSNSIVGNNSASLGAGYSIDAYLRVKFYS